jgi:rieske iron-sulfur protein
MQDTDPEYSYCPSPDAAKRVADAAAGTDEVRPAAGPDRSANSGQEAACLGRRRLLVTALTTCVGVAVARTVHAQDDERPQAADLLVFAEGAHAGEVIKPDDLPLGGRPALAWPMDPKTKVVRKGSRLNEVLVVRLKPAEIDDETRPHAADGIVAYSAVCSHAGCTVTGWMKAANGDQNVFKCLCHNSEYDPRQNAQVVFGPAPRRLAALPLAMGEGSITVAAGFVGKVGVQQAQ